MLDVIENRRFRTCLATAITFCFYLAALGSFAAQSPYHDGFDDYEYVPAAKHWRDTNHLTTQGVFLRVPLWIVLMGTVFKIVPVPLAVPMLQSLIVLGSVACTCAYVASRHGFRSKNLVYYLPVCVFAISPQVSLYARHAVNELFIGLLLMLTILLARHPTRRRCLAMGLVCGLGAMTKPIALFLLLPAICSLRANAIRHRFLGRMGMLIAGGAIVVVPTFLFCYLQRNIPLLDNTAAFNLNDYELKDWVALGDHQHRYEAGMAAWWRKFRDSPTDYLSGVLGRSYVWLLRPSTKDMELFYREYPHAFIQVADQIVFFVMVFLAVIGTDRKDLCVWLFPLAVLVGCCFPLHTPYTPKVLWLFATVLLAPKGLESLFGHPHAGAKEGASQPN